MRLMILSVFLYLIISCTEKYPIHYSSNENNYFKTELCLIDSGNFIYSEVLDDKIYYEKGKYKFSIDTIEFQVIGVGFELCCLVSEPAFKKGLLKNKSIILLRSDNSPFLTLSKKNRTRCIN